MSPLVLAIVIFLLVQVADVWTTMEAMDRGAHDNNETIADWMEDHGETEWIKRKFGLSLFALAVMAVAGYPVVINAVSGIMAIVVLWNVRWIIKLGD